MSSLPIKSIKEYTEDHSKKMISHLVDLVEIETPSRNTQHHAKLFQKVENNFSELNYETRRLPGVKTGNHLYARPKEYKQNSRFQLLLGHADTVWPLDTLQERPVRIEDNEKLNGPGAFDMKAGLTTLIFALRALYELDIKLDVTPLILINSDEEIGSPDSTRLIKRLARMAERTFVLEPSGPNNTIRVARKGSGHFEICIEGKAAHAGIEPEAGANAIHAMSEVIDHLRDIGTRFKNGSINVGTIEGGIQGNVVAPNCKIEVDARATTKEMADTITMAIHSIESSMEDTKVKTIGEFRQPPMEESEESLKLLDLANDLSDQLDIKLREAPSGGASDGNTASQYTPTLDGLGPTGGGAHQKNEYVNLESLPERVALLVGLLAQDSAG